MGRLLLSQINMKLKVKQKIRPKIKLKIRSKIKLRKKRKHLQFGACHDSMPRAVGVFLCARPPSEICQQKLTGARRAGRGRKLPARLRASVVRSVAFRHRINLALSCHFVTLQIFVIGRHLIDHRAVWQKFNDPVCGGLHDLMVAAGK